MKLKPETHDEKVRRMMERIIYIDDDLAVVSPYRLAELLVEMTEGE